MYPYLPLRPWQTKTHCYGHIVAETNVSPFARARNICCGHKFCVRDTKDVSDFVQKHSVSATNVSQFAQPRKHHGQQCVRNNVSSFASTFRHKENNTKYRSLTWKPRSHVRVLIYRTWPIRSVLSEWGQTAWLVSLSQVTSQQIHHIYSSKQLFFNNHLECISNEY